MRFWSKWCWNIHFWMAFEVYDKFHDNRTSFHGATSMGNPSDAILEMYPAAGAAALLCSEWSWNIHYWVTSEIYSNSLGIRLAVGRATASGIPSNTKLRPPTPRWDPARIRSKWHWNIHYWSIPKTCFNYLGSWLAVCWATQGRTSSNTKLRLRTWSWILDGSAQIDIEIYIIDALLKDIPISMTIGCLWRKLDLVEFPQILNFD
jgi:hypothetical protein